MQTLTYPKCLGEDYKIHVRVDGNKGRLANGTYELSDKRAEDAPQNLVWKHTSSDRYIFNDGKKLGWRIGNEDSLKTGSHYAYSKSLSRKVGMR